MIWRINLRNSDYKVPRLTPGIFGGLYRPSLGGHFERRQHARLKAGATTKPAQILQGSSISPLDDLRDKLRNRFTTPHNHQIPRKVRPEFDPQRFQPIQKFRKLRQSSIFHIADSLPADFPMPRRAESAISRQLPEYTFRTY